MTLLTELEEFVRDHRPHGTLTGDATEPAWNGYLLTVACPCGAVFRLARRGCTGEDLKSGRPTGFPGSRLRSVIQAAPREWGIVQALLKSRLEPRRRRDITLPCESSPL
jgi:hypothetical protein